MLEGHPLFMKSNNSKGELYCKERLFVGFLQSAGRTWPSVVLLVLAGVLLPLHGRARGAGGHDCED